MTTTDATVEIDLSPGKRGEPPVIYGNVYTTILLNDLFDIGFVGFNFNGGIVRRVRGGLRISIARGGLNGKEIFWTKRELHRVLHVFNELRDYAGEVIYVGATDAEGSDTEAITRHEQMHSAQRRLGGNGLDIGHAGDAEAFLSHPLAAKAAIALVGELQYADDPDTLVAEIGSHLIEGFGGAAKLGLTGEEGEELAQFYWTAVLDCNGSRAYHQRALLPLIEQWSLSNEPDFGTDGETEPRQGGGSTQRKGAAGQPATAGRCSQIAP